MGGDGATWSALGGGLKAGLRALCGFDEESIDGTDTLAAIRLLDRLLIEGPPGAIGPGSAAELVSADRDRLLAALYLRTYGSRIQGTVACVRCGEPFDLDFPLQQLLDTLPQPGTAGPAHGGDGLFALPDGRRFRMPTGEDELAVWHLPPDQAEQALLARCVVEGDPSIDSQAFQEAMLQAAPLLDVEIDTRCPECGQEQSIHFDIQSYLLSALRSEQLARAQEVHRLATAYGWSLSDILSLPRSRRRTHVALIEAEFTRQARGYA